MKTESCDVLLLAAGRGERLGRDAPKARVLLAGDPLFVHALRCLATHPEVGRIVLIAPIEETEFAAMREIAESESCAKLERVIIGGQRRQDSTWLGLNLLRELGASGQRMVMVHDAARPHVSHPLIDRCLQGLRDPLPETEQVLLPGIGSEGSWGGGPAGSIPGLPIRETLKMVYDGRVVLTQPRDGLYAVQTPQAFRFGPLFEAHRRARQLELEATDDSVLLESLGMPVRIVEGDPENIKVTYPEDLLLAERTHQWRKGMGSGAVDPGGVDR